jgi:hypothetical protein
MGRLRKDWLEWVRVDRDLPDHPKIHRLAAKLDCDAVTALGHAVTLWLWGARFCPLGKLDPDRIKAANNKLAVSLEIFDACGFIDGKRGEDGALIGGRIHGFYEMNASQLTSRIRKRNNRRDNVVTQPRQIMAESGPTGRYGTVQKSKTRTPPLPPLPVLTPSTSAHDDVPHGGKGGVRTRTGTGGTATAEGADRNTAELMTGDEIAAEIGAGMARAARGLATTGLRNAIADGQALTLQRAAQTQEPAPAAPEDLERLAQEARQQLAEQFRYERHESVDPAE